MKKFTYTEKKDTRSGLHLLSHFTMSRGILMRLPKA